MSKNKMIELLCPLLFLSFGIYIRISALSMSRRDATFPNLVAYIVIAVSIIQLVMDMRKSEHKARFKNVNFLKLAECIGAMLLYVVLLKKIGFLVDTFLLTSYTMYALEYRKYKVLFIAAAIITAVIFLVFRVLLHVPLPTIWL
ncbi:MAG: tripartite tricarboxylate transporter TctB family protein [Lawsonibacter sp.]|nr:tripartite tricarboxylate transporter TctB family protein [Lawsonibacter sp.]